MRQIDWVELHCWQEGLGIWSSTRSEASWVFLSPASHLLVNVNYSAVFKFGVCSISLMSQTSHRVCGVSGSLWPQSPWKPHETEWTRGGYVGKLYVSPFLPFLPACLPAVEGIDFWKMAKRKKNVVPKTSSCGKAWFFFLCVCVSVCAHISLYTNTCLWKRSVSICAGSTCMEVRGELVELVLSCCVCVGCALVSRLRTH